MTLILDKEKLAWAAGFFDGEGCTTFKANQKKPNGRMYGIPVLQVTQCSNLEKYPEVLEKFNEAVGRLGHQYGPYNKKSAAQLYYQLDITGFEEVQAVVAMLWPWLSSVKRQQAEKALEAYKIYSKRKQCKRGPKPKTERRL